MSLSSRWDDAGPDRHVAVPRRGRRRRRETYVVLVRLVVFVLERERRAADVVEERVDERARPVLVRRVHDHPRGFVDHDQVVVLVDDVKRDRLGPRLDWRRALEAALDPVARRQRRRDFSLDRAVDRHVAVLDAALHLRARRVRECVGDINVEPLPGLVAFGHVEHDERFFPFVRRSFVAHPTATEVLPYAAMPSSTRSTSSEVL